MRKLLIAIVLAGVLFRVAIAGEIPTTTNPIPPPPETLIAKIIKALFG